MIFNIKDVDGSLLVSTMTPRHVLVRQLIGPRAAGASGWTGDGNCSLPCNTDCYDDGGTKTSGHVGENGIPVLLHLWFFLVAGNQHREDEEQW